MGHPLQHRTQALGARLHQPDRYRTAISYADRCRIANGVHASGEGPIFLEAHVARVHSNMVYAKSMHIYQGSGGLPILHTELVRNGNVRAVNQRALELLARDKMDISLLQALQTRVTEERALLEKAAEKGEFPSFITPDAGVIRPLMPENDNFAVGTGPGTLHLRLLAEHVSKVLGEKAAWVDFTVEPMTFEPRPTDKQKMAPQERASRIEAGELLHTIGFPRPKRWPPP
ncbi:pPIWI_RE module domain-containing protein [Streptomyces fimicarius]|uniref:pPIWI_RE module domain-containing protein n=1 Tax=Streptomyces griseus TaxID=1911 RepID=UPI0036AA233A